MSYSNSVAAEVARNRGWFLFLGILLIIAGSVALILPAATAIAVDLLIACLLILSGIASLIQAFSARQWRGVLLTRFSGLLALAAGILLLAFPWEGALSLALLLAAFFLADGVIRVSLALRMRGEKGWGWFLVSGILALIIGCLVAAGWLGSSLYFIGILVGLHLLLSGWAVMFIGLTMRKACSR